MIKNNVPFDGVQEVCLLHDVVEDTEFTLDDVRDIYMECGFENYFDMYIKDALERITHDKTVDYGTISKFVLKPDFSISQIDWYGRQPTIRFGYMMKKDITGHKDISSTFVINEAYHFVENAEKYKKQLEEDEEWNIYY